MKLDAHRFGDGLDIMLGGRNCFRILSGVKAPSAKGLVGIVNVATNEESGVRGIGEDDLGAVLDAIGRMGKVYTWPELEEAARACLVRP